MTPHQHETIALFTVVARCLRQEGSALPANLTPAARRLARNQKIDSPTKLCIFAIAVLTDD